VCYSAPLKTKDPDASIRSLFGVRCSMFPTPFHLSTRTIDLAESFWDYRAMRSFSLRSFLLLSVALILSLTGCRNAMYSAYEKVGIYKRDLLKKRVIAARDEEKGAQQEFKDALTRLKELTGFDGGELEKHYRQLQSNYDDAASRVTAVHKRVQDVETVAGDLFDEWDKENREIETPELRQVSRKQLDDTRERYDKMLAALKRSEQSMDPVLRKLHDYVLALKHTLNAEAIDALGGESTKIQADVSKLIEEMNTSIAHADEFIKQMPK
jgi:hypothetical protein